MKNDRNVKQVSRLTSALLARKGSATPSHEKALMEQQPMNGFLEAAIVTAKQVNFRQNGSAKSGKQINESNKNANLGRVSVKKSRSANSSRATAAKKRIAMTLRMEEENHLNLRIYSAYTRKSCQVILSEALDIYLTENNDKVPLLKKASQNI